MHNFKVRDRVWTLIDGEPWAGTVINIMGHRIKVIFDSKPGSRGVWYDVNGPGVFEKMRPSCLMEKNNE